MPGKDTEYCTRCKRFYHKSKDCFASRDIDGYLIPERVEESDSEDDSDSDYLGSDEDD